MSTSAATATTSYQNQQNDAMVVENSMHNNISNEDVENNKPSSSRAALYKKLLTGLILAGFIVFVIIDSTTTKYLQTAIEQFLDWVGENPIAGFFGVIVVYFFATVLFIPGSLLTLGSGYIFANAFGLGWGVVIGSASVFLGASSGASASFLLAKYVLRDWVTEALTKKYTIFEALDTAFQENGLRIMTLLRLSPIIPFNAINYIAGITAISFLHYVLAFVGMLPGTILYVFLGASAGSIADAATSGSSPTLTIIIVVVGVVFGVLAIALTSYYAKKQLNRILEEKKQQEGEENVTNDDDDKKEQSNEESYVDSNATDVNV